MNTISDENTELPKTNTIVFSGSRTDVVRFVAKLLLLSKSGLLSTTVITRGSSEDCSAIFVIEESLVETVKSLEPSASLQLTII